MFLRSAQPGVGAGDINRQSCKAEVVGEVCEKCWSLLFLVAA